ncbi:MAG: hypothetical protein ABSG21_11390 [Spirochaetia bacterium]|jgi:hypothetical protein
MKKLILTILALIALFSALRAYTEPASPPGVALHPGLVEIGDGSTSIGIAFGVMEKSGEEPSTWSLLPLRLVYKSGDTNLTIGLNGLSFLLRGGVSVGRPVKVDSPRTGDVLSIGGKVTVNSRVDGDVWAVGADVELSPRAEVTGSVVTLGGKVAAAPGAVVRGTVSQVPQIKIPFLGILGTQFSVQVLATGHQLLGYVLLGFALFLSCFYREGHARMMYQSIPASWREAVITLAVSLVVIPVVTLLLIVSVIGIFFIPVLAFVVILLTLDGFLFLCVRLGGVLRRLDIAQSRNVPLSLVTSGLLGLFIVKLPALVGIFLTLLRSGAATLVGQMLQVITLACVSAGMLYGFGAALAFSRRRSIKD